MDTYNINDEKTWGKFVQKLIQQTKEGKIIWKDFRGHTYRPEANGSIFFSEIAKGKFVAVYRYVYPFYTDVDEYQMREGIAIELVDSKCNRLWSLPEVHLEYSLIDLLEYQAADAEGLLNSFLKDIDEHE